MGVFPPWYCYHYKLVNFFVVGMVLCIIGCLPASLPMPIGPFSQAVTSKNVSSHYQMSPAGQICLQLRIIVLSDKLLI